jgi:hypothetical protein
MGFKAPARRTVTLPFTGELEGLVGTVRRASQSALRAAAELMELSDGPDITESDARAILGLFDRFARALVSWNVEDPETGDPIPATAEGIADLDDDFILKIIMSWLATVEADGAGQAVIATAELHADQVAVEDDAELVATLPVEPLTS